MQLSLGAKFITVYTSIAGHLIHPIGVSSSASSSAPPIIENILLRLATDSNLISDLIAFHFSRRIEDTQSSAELRRRWSARGCVSAFAARGLEQ